MYGTTFYFDLPEWYEPAITVVDNSSLQPHLPILICEDDSDLANLLKLLLEQAGFKTDIAHNAAQAKQMLTQNQYAAITTSKMTGFEALARWQHPERGLISPSEFILVAEETGLILPLGEWVLRCACHQMRAWQVQFSEKPPLRISVNFSAKQFTQPDLIQLVSRTLQQTELAPGSLKMVSWRSKQL